MKRISKKISIVCAFIVILLISNSVFASLIELHNTEVNIALDSAIQMVDAVNEQYPKEKINEEDGVAIKLIDSITVTTRKQQHKYATGQESENFYLDLYSQDNTKELKENHKKRVTQVKVLSDEISEACKQAKKEVKKQKELTWGERRALKKELNLLKKLSVSTLNRILGNYATDIEYEAVYNSINTVWDSIDGSQYSTDEVKQIVEKMEELHDIIPEYSIGQGNLHIWWILKGILLLIGVMFIYYVIMGIIQALPYIAEEGVNVVFREIGSVLNKAVIYFIEVLQDIEWEDILDKCKMKIWNMQKVIEKIYKKIKRCIINLKSK